MHPKDTDWMASSVDSRSSLIWVGTVCPDLSVRKLRIIKVIPHSLMPRLTIKGSRSSARGSVHTTISAGLYWNSLHRIWMLNTIYFTLITQQGQRTYTILESADVGAFCGLMGRRNSSTQRKSTTLDRRLLSCHMMIPRIEPWPQCCKAMVSPMP